MLSPIWCLVVLGVALLTACGERAATRAPVPSAIDARATYPPGPEGLVLTRARRLLDRTPQLMPAYVRAGIACSSCHIAGGTQARALSFLGAYAKYPQYNARAHRYIALQDRIAECFLYSLNGRAPAYDSDEMIAIVTYVAWLSRGAVVGAGFPDVAMPQIATSAPPDAGTGKAVYGARCSTCHGATGAGVAGAIPPLWGPKSFNTGAVMHRTDTLAAFVRANMPPTAAGTLSEREALDIAAYILGQPRPKFQGNAPQVFQPEPARFF